ncbi:MAG: PAS domain-containing protein [Acidobacteriota bacterium]
MSSGSQEPSSLANRTRPTLDVEEPSRVLAKEKLDARSLFQSLIDHIPDRIYFKDLQAHFVYVSRSMAQQFGRTPDQLIGKCDHDFFKPKLADEKLADDLSVIQGTPLYNKVESDDTLDGQKRWVSTTKIPWLDRQGHIVGLLGISRDITERRQLQEQLAQAQKLESIGQLSAGIAHEINTPTQFIGDNLRFFQQACHGLREVIATVMQLRDQMRESPDLQPALDELDERMTRLDFDFLVTEVPKCIQESLDGIQRIAKIVSAMKDFSHPGGSEKTPADLNQLIESTCTVARNEWKYVANLELELCPELPLVPCHAGELNQAVLNILVNAAHAIADANAESKEKGKIVISTHRLDTSVEIRISDTGTGIPDHILPRVFDPFFTTKEVGKGTGQGLAIARSVVMDKHGGLLRCESKTGEGTTFILSLPLDHSVIVEHRGGGATWNES